MDSRVLGGQSPVAFLREYWQQKPLLVRAALPGYTSPLSPEELMALACADQVPARVVMESCGNYPWEVDLGPFDLEGLQSLPDGGWTMLAGQVDRHVPEIAEIVTPFRFLPNWRIEDVQVSYAPPGGTAGPHVDNYDVFLVQGYGQRRWRIGNEPAPQDAALVPDADVAILADFRHDEEWILSPGDLLYLPPRIPHFGVAVDHCMTISVGFRAPAARELMHHFFYDAVEKLDGSARFGDAHRAPLEHPGQIGAADLAWVRQVIRRAQFLDGDIDRWFGRYVTARDDDFAPSEPLLTARELVKQLNLGRSLRRLSVAYLAHIEEAGCTRLFGGGEEFVCKGRRAAGARLVTGTQPLTLQSLSPYLDMPDFVQILVRLVNGGCLTVEAA